MNVQLFSKLIPVLVLLALLSACTRKKEVIFRYADSTPIKDSVLVKFLTRQLADRIPDYDTTESINVQTYLDRKIERKLTRFFRQNPLKKASAVLIMENGTGNVVYCRSDELNPHSPRFQNMKMYGMLMSFERGVKLADTFSWIGKFSGEKRTRTVAALYRMSPPTLDYKYPFDTYSCAQWTAFLHKLDISTKQSDCADGDWFPRYYFRTSLFDLVKTGSLISRNGFAAANNFFGDIKDSDGKIVTSREFVKGKLLKTESCLLLKKVLKRSKSDLVVFNYPIYINTGGEIRNGMLFSTGKYTIGFLADSKSANTAVVSDAIADMASML